MTIQEINLIRKNFSMIKGGRLARIAYPSKIKTLVVSDIPGDDITQVASGPTLPSNGRIIYTSPSQRDKRQAPKPSSA